MLLYTTVARSIMRQAPFASKRDSVVHGACSCGDDVPGRPGLLYLYHLLGWWCAAYGDAKMLGICFLVGADSSPLTQSNAVEGVLGG